jgi:hypothetical protein
MLVACLGALIYVRFYCNIFVFANILKHQSRLFPCRGIGRCIKAQRLNTDGSLAAPYLPQESCDMIAFERSIGLQGALLPLNFDVDEAAISCGSMFFPMSVFFHVFTRMF